MSETLAPPHGLATGMRMDWPEFEARSLDIPELKRAELLDGVVHLPSLVSMNRASAQSAIAGWLFHYHMKVPGLHQTLSLTLVLDSLNAPIADGVLWIDRGEANWVRGASGLEYLAPPIELVVEVRDSADTRDAKFRRDLYHRFGVREYLNWRVTDDAFDWLAWRPEGYAALAPDAEGVLRSEVFPGLWLDTRALLAANLAALLTTVAAGCNTPEHAAFVEWLRAG